MQADLANERRRKAGEIERGVRREKTRFLSGMLDVVDNLERAMAQSAGADEALLSGLGSVLEQARTVMAAQGLRRIELGDGLFDPERHEAVGLDDAAEPGRIAAELSPGYCLDDEILRASKVLVGRTETE